MRNEPVLCNRWSIHHLTSFYSLLWESFSLLLPHPTERCLVHSVAPRRQKSSCLETQAPFPCQEFLLDPSQLPWSSFPFDRTLEISPSFGFLFNLATMDFVPRSFHSSGRGWVYAAHFLPPPNDKPTRPFCSVGFTENHQEEKENNKRTHVEEMWQYKNAYITA